MKLSVLLLLFTAVFVADASDRTAGFVTDASVHERRASTSDQKRRAFASAQTRRVSTDRRKTLAVGQTGRVDASPRADRASAPIKPAVQTAEHKARVYTSPGALGTVSSTPPQEAQVTSSSAPLPEKIEWVNPFAKWELRLAAITDPANMNNVDCLETAEIRSQVLALAAERHIDYLVYILGVAAEICGTKLPAEFNQQRPIMAFLPRPVMELLAHHLRYVALSSKGAWVPVPFSHQVKAFQHCLDIMGKKKVIDAIEPELLRNDPFFRLITPKEMQAEKVDQPNLKSALLDLQWEPSMSKFYAVQGAWTLRKIELGVPRH